MWPLITLVLTRLVSMQFENDVKFRSGVVMHGFIICSVCFGNTTSEAQHFTTEAFLN